MKFNKHDIQVVLILGGLGCLITGMCLMSKIFCMVGAILFISSFIVGNYEK